MGTVRKQKSESDILQLAEKIVELESDIEQLKASLNSRDILIENLEAYISVLERAIEIKNKIINRNLRLWICPLLS